MKKEKRVIILDTETTGLDHSSGDEIVEIGLIEVINGEIISSKNLRYNPYKPIGIIAQNVHSLNFYDLKNFPRFDEENLLKLGEFLGGDDLVIHNAPFDMGMLNASYERYGLKFSDYHGQVIDTLKLARAIFKGTKQKCTLNALCDYYMIDTSSRVYHGALIDCYLLVEVFNKLLPNFYVDSLNEGNNGNNTLNSFQPKTDLSFQQFSF